MSDIAIRFDGLLLGLAILLSAAIFDLIMLVALIVATCSPPHRRYGLGLAGMAALRAMNCAAALVLLAGFVEHAKPLPPVDWLDWGIVPWTMLFAIGLWRLIRFRPQPERGH